MLGPASKFIENGYLLSPYSFAAAFSHQMLTRLSTMEHESRADIR